MWRLISPTGKEYQMPVESFRKIMQVSYNRLRTMKNQEGKTFPKSDQTVLDIIFQLIILENLT